MKNSTRESLVHYMEHRVHPGGFLRAFLANDLMEAMRRADDENMRDFREIGLYVYSEMPSLCHGSYEAVDKWLSTKKAA